MNISIKREYFFLICLSILSLSSFSMAQEQESDNFLAFVSEPRITHETIDQIARILENNIEKAEKINRQQEIRHETGGYYGSRYHLQCTNFYLVQKQLELLQWQYQMANDRDSCDAIARKIMTAHVNQINTAKTMAIESNGHQKLGRLEYAEYIDCEITLDRTVQEWLNFLSIDQIFKFFEYNTAKAEHIRREFQDIHVHPNFPLATPFSKLYVEFYYQQKRIEFFRYQYENTKDDTSRQTVAKNLVAFYEKQLDTAKKLADISKELFQQKGIMFETVLTCETQLDQVILEMARFVQNNSPGDTDDVGDPVREILKNNVQKGQRILEECQNLATQDSQRLFLVVYYSRHAEFYFQQKQIALLRWEYENASCPIERKTIAEKLMDVYKQQWHTANELAKTSREMFEVGTCPMKQYLDCENMLDRTTLDMLHFMLDVSCQEIEESPTAE